MYIHSCTIPSGRNNQSNQRSFQRTSYSRYIYAYFQPNICISNFTPRRKARHLAYVPYNSRTSQEFEDRFHSRTFWICPPYLHLFLTSLFPFSLSVYIYTYTWFHSFSFITSFGIRIFILFELELHL